MTGSPFCVVVQELRPRDFSWLLMRKQSSQSLAECVAVSSSGFAVYDEALDAGFVALQALVNHPGF